VLKRPDNSLDAAAVRRVLDLIHLRYMAKHAPDGALAFMTEQKMLGVPFEAYWPRPEIHQPLYEAARIGTSAAGSMHVAVQKSSRRSGRTYNLPTRSLARPLQCAMARACSRSRWRLSARGLKAIPKLCATCPRDWDVFVAYGLWKIGLSGISSE
jgi:hypothetical protein